MHSTGLLAVDAVETSGIVFVTQDAPGGRLDDLPPIVPAHRRLSATLARELPVNWKIAVEGFLEGYHIRTTHRDTFYPVQFDNLNVVERFGRNSRVTFPYRAINKLRARPPAERSVDGKLTYVYHLFPNAIVATFPAFMTMVVLEPLAVDRTRFITYALSRPGAGPSDGKQLSEFVDAGAVEDNAMACAVQRGLAAGANEFFEFGRFEGAIGHFHRNLHAALAG